MIDQNEIEKSTVKSLFSLIKFPILGEALNELIDYRGKIKQKRLNQFTELLENYFSNHKGINLENFQTVEFSDLFESVVKRVVQNNPDEKLSLYKNVLINQLNNIEFNIDHSEIFLDLIATLQVIEIQILKEHARFDKHFDFENNSLKTSEILLKNKESGLDWITNKQPIGHEGQDIKLKEEISDLKTKIEEQKIIIAELQKIKTPQHYSISDSDFLFYKQRLLSKGLLVDVGIGAIGYTPFINMGVTEFGVQFIQYIINS